MSRYIDADALKAKMWEASYTDLFRFTKWVDVVSVADIDDAPSIEPKRGEWEATTMVDCGASIYLCSVCEYEVTRLSNFCPNCGCAMTKE